MKVATKGKTKNFFKISPSVLKPQLSIEDSEN
jgi:hypothetical protein